MNKDAEEIAARLVAEKAARLQADRLTIEEAAKELADNAGWKEKAVTESPEKRRGPRKKGDDPIFDRWVGAIITAVKENRLTLRNPSDLEDPLPYAMPLTRIEAAHERSDRFKHHPEEWIWYFDHHVTRVDLNKWLEKHPEWKIDHRFTTTAVKTTALARVSVFTFEWPSRLIPPTISSR